MLPVERARDIGVGGLKRRLAEQQRTNTYAGTSRGRLRRGDYTGARLGPGQTSSGLSVDELEQILDDLSRLTTEQHDQVVARLDDLDTRARRSLPPAPLTLSTPPVAVYTPTGGEAMTPMVEVINGIAYVDGQIAPSGTWTSGSVYGVGSLPAGVTGPARQRQLRGATNGVDTSIRLLVNPNGTIQLVCPQTVPTWVDLSTLFWPVT